jgi:hypothetical protein
MHFRVKNLKTILEQFSVFQRKNFAKKITVDSNYEKNILTSLAQPFFFLVRNKSQLTINLNKINAKFCTFRISNL